MIEQRILTEDELKKFVELTDVMLQYPQAYEIMGYYTILKAIRNKVAKMRPPKLNVVMLPDKLGRATTIKSDFIEQILVNSKKPD